MSKKYYIWVLGCQMNKSDAERTAAILDEIGYKEANGEKEALRLSDTNFIEKASGIYSRYVIDKQGILDIEVMHPLIQERGDSSLSLQAEMAVHAAKKALEDANICADEVDAIILACSYTQRAYPAMSIEVQNALGIKGFAFDMNEACSSMTFAIQMADSLIKTEAASTVLIVNPEICSGHINFRSRDAHFIFGDAATATLVCGSELYPNAKCKLNRPLLSAKKDKNGSLSVLFQAPVMTPSFISMLTFVPCSFSIAITESSSNTHSIPSAISGVAK